MPVERKKIVSTEDLRHAEYYGMQGVYDDLYARSKAGEHFTDLLSIVLSRNNILLAYRNIKANTGSNTAGTDKLTIKDIGEMPVDEMVEKVRYIVTGSKHGYRPKPVRRKDIPKPHDPTATRPLGIPCIWDRLIQQCIKQVMEPICEAKFSENSFGFRPNRSVENAIARTYNLMQLSHLHFIIEFDIKGFFDNVDHPKLIRQIWAMGIRDKSLIYVLRQILTAPIRMPDGKTVYPTKGTPQGGIISPLLANIVLNELDHWVESQWQSNPVTRNYYIGYAKNGSENLGHGYRAMRGTRLKEMYIVRYADDFRIFCRNKSDAEKTKIAVTQWLSERLKLEVSQEKTRIVNIRHGYSDFLGIKIRVREKGQKYVVQSHISDKSLKQKKAKLIEQAKRIASPRKGKTELEETRLYNAMVMGMQNYYCLATDVSDDFNQLNHSVMTVLINRLNTERGTRLVRKGRPLSEVERQRYGRSRRLRYVAGTGEPIYPIGQVRRIRPRCKQRSWCAYSPEGRIGLHDNLRINVPLMLSLMRQPLKGRSMEYADNRISLFCAQWGKCAITEVEFRKTSEIHCHHKKPKHLGGGDEYENLTLVQERIHRLIHASKAETLTSLLQSLTLNDKQINKVNELRKMAGLRSIYQTQMTNNL